MPGGLSDQSTVALGQILAAVAPSIATQVDAAVPPIVATSTAPFFRFSVAPSLIALNAVLVGILVDRPGTLASISIVASTLASGTMTVVLKKNGALVKTINVTTTTQVIDLSTPAVSISSLDRLTLEVSVLNLVLGLGTVYGHIKTTV